MIIEIVLGIVILVEGYVIWNLMRKTELLETWVEDFGDRVTRVNQELSDVLKSKIRMFTVFPGSVTGSEPDNQKIADAFNFLVSENALSSAEVTFCVDETR